MVSSTPGEFPLLKSPYRWLLLLMRVLMLKLSQLRLGLGVQQLLGPLELVLELLVQVLELELTQA
jgi:hypothetical protein